MRIDEERNKISVPTLHSHTKHDLIDVKMNEK